MLLTGSAPGLQKPSRVRIVARESVHTEGGPVDRSPSHASRPGRGVHTRSPRVPARASPPRSKWALNHASPVLGRYAGRHGARRHGRRAAGRPRRAGRDVPPTLRRSREERFSASVQGRHHRWRGGSRPLPCDPQRRLHRRRAQRGTRLPCHPVRPADRQDRVPGRRRPVAEMGEPELLRPLGRLPSGNDPAPAERRAGPATRLPEREGLQADPQRDEAERDPRGTHRQSSRARRMGLLRHDHGPAFRDRTVGLAVSRDRTRSSTISSGAIRW